MFQFSAECSIAFALFIKFDVQEGISHILLTRKLLVLEMKHKSHDDSNTVQKLMGVNKNTSIAFCNTECDPNNYLRLEKCHIF